MKTIRYYFPSALLLALVMVFTGCERDEFDLEPAKFSTNGEVFIDGFSGGLEYSAFGNSKLTAFTVDEEVSFEGTAGSSSIRYDIPNAGDPEGAFAGGVFTDLGGRDLTGFDALTFYARASKSATIDVIGFGNDFIEDKFSSTASLRVDTKWTKYIIPIPDPSVLTEEKGLLVFSEGPENGEGYTVWIDVVKFESLGTIAQPRPSILNGETVTQKTFIGVTTQLSGLAQTFNLPSGGDITVNTTGAFFTFDSSDENVATVNDEGLVTVVGQGTATITAKLGEEDASGSLIIESSGEFVSAPTPTEDAANVISVFSDAYDNIPVDFYNGFFAPFQTTLGGADLNINGDNIIKYTELNFVATEFKNPTLDATAMTHFHVDIQVEDAIEAGDFIRVELGDFGADAAFGGGDDSSGSVTISDSQLETGTWLSFDFPLADFADLGSRANLAQIFFISDATISSILVDNMYFYTETVVPGPTEPTVAAPTPTEDAAAVISLFSDAYTDVPVDTWRTDWSSATFEDVMIAGNATKKYSALDFVGIETVSNQVDASAMTHFRMDVWSGNFTQFSIKIVDFGPDGAFDGGDDTEQQLDFAMPAQGEWVSYDIPLTDFTNLTTTANIAQFILVGQPTGTTTVFVDNMYFYDSNSTGGGGGATEPTVAAPTPTQNAFDVISLFSDAYTDVTVDTWRTDWSSATFEDVMIAGNATKKYSALDFVGIETIANQVDATAMTHFHIDVWSGDFTQFSIKLVDIGPDGTFGGGDDTEQQLDFPMPTQGVWVSYDIPLSDFTNLTTTANIAQYILVGQPTGTTTIFVDNMFFYDENGTGPPSEPTVAAPTPTEDPADVISLFSDAYTDVTVDTWRTDWSSATFEDVMIAGNATKKYSALDFVGIETVANQVDASAMTHFHIDVWSSDFTQFGIKLVDFGGDGAGGGGDDTEHQINYPSPMQGTWVSYDIPLSDFTGVMNYMNIAQYILVGQPTGTNTIFVDNMYFYDDGSGSATEPTVAAPTPTEDPADVISLFSDAYTDVTVDTWLEGASSATFADVMIAGNATKKYSDLDFAIIETVANQVDASSMTHFHMDVWSPDFTQFSIKLVDFGGDGTAGGGDDTEQQLDYASPMQGSWVSYDIPLSDFTNLTNVMNIAQYILVGQPTGTTTVFVDNMYFYDDGSSAATTIIDLTFDDAASINDWMKVADATGAEATITWADGEGVTGGAMQVAASNPTTDGKAYIFQLDATGLNYNSATDVRLTFDLKLGAPLVAAAVHLQTNIPGTGVVNNFDLQAQGLNESTYTSFSFDFSSVDMAATTFTIHFNFASGAVMGSGGTLLVDNVKLVTN